MQPNNTISASVFTTLIILISIFWIYLAWKINWQWDIINQQEHEKQQKKLISNDKDEIMEKLDEISNYQKNNCFN